MLGIFSKVVLGMTAPNRSNVNMGRNSPLFDPTREHEATVWLPAAFPFHLRPPI